MKKVLYKYKVLLLILLLFLFISQIPFVAFLFADFNAHNLVRGGRKTDQKEKSVGDFIEEAGVVVLNDGSGSCQW